MYLVAAVSQSLVDAGPGHGEGERLYVALLSKPCAGAKFHIFTPPGIQWSLVKSCAAFM